MFSEKMDVLDFVISTLKEHEKALDEIAHRLEKAVVHLVEPDDRDQMRRFYE